MIKFIDFLDLKTLNGWVRVDRPIRIYNIETIRGDREVYRVWYME